MLQALEEEEIGGFMGEVSQDERARRPDAVQVAFMKTLRAIERRKDRIC
jgi:hypothetical protein